jgi:hypothetical protein
MEKSILNDIQGTWLLMSMNIIDSSGQSYDMYGKDPQGISTFDTKGYLNAQMGASGRPLFASEILNQGSAEEITSAYKSYMAFFGRYKETSPGTLSIRLEGCLFPNWEGKEIIRYAEITDNLLYLTTPPTQFGNITAIVKAVWKKA